MHVIDSILLPSAAPTSINHLYFRGIDNSVKGLDRCGDVDAAPRMPNFLFDPKYAAALKLYVHRYERPIPDGAR